MKFFKALAIVCLFFFLIGCEESIKKLGPEDEAHDGGSDVTDNDVVDTDVEPTDDGDSTEPTEPTDDGDSTEPTEPTSDGDSTEPTNDEDSTDPTNDGDSTEPTNDEDSTDPTNDEDQVVVTPQKKCETKNGTWESEAQRCYQIKNCEPDKPANSEWNGDSSYKIYYDANVEILEPLTYPTHYGDGEPEICQYKCIANHDYVNGECKPYCSAVFNGTDSMITIASEDAPSIVGLESWTIEAWIKQSADNLPDYQIYPVLRKGTSTSHPEYLLSGYYNGNNGNGYGLTVSTYYSYQQYGQPKTADNQVNATLSTLPEGWSHVAMVYTTATETTTGWGGQQQTTVVHKLTIFINGEPVQSGKYGGVPTFVPNDEPLVFGARNSDRYFTGLIDSIRISDAALYNENENFEPSKLSANDTTIAFWDFSGNANDSVSGIIGMPTSIGYSTDCVQ